MIVRQGALMVVPGTVIGVLAALALSRLARSVLVGVSPGDPFTFVGISVLLTTVGVAASLIPARRASKVDPMVALRHE